MAYKSVITIGRQFGSGGHEIGEILAKKLDVPFYDKDILKIAAKESGMCEELFENFDEKPTNSFLYSLVMDPYSLGYHAANMDMPLNHKVFLAAFETIQKIAEKGPCVIVGRCADYALSDLDESINFFISSPTEVKINRIMEKHNLSHDKAKDMLTKEDKKRASYYNYYTTKKWGHIKSYEFCIDSSVLGIEGTAELMKQIVLMKEAEQTN